MPVMKKMTRTSALCAALVMTVLAMLALPTGVVKGQDNEMSFFLTSQGPGDGANLGGLEGADGHCQMLASAAGAGGTPTSALAAQGA